MNRTDGIQQAGNIKKSGEELEVEHADSKTKLANKLELDDDESVDTGMTDAEQTDWINSQFIYNAEEEIIKQAKEAALELFSKKGIVENIRYYDEER